MIVDGMRSYRDADASEQSWRVWVTAAVTLVTVLFLVLVPDMDFYSDRPAGHTLHRATTRVAVVGPDGTTMSYADVPAGTAPSSTVLGQVGQDVAPPGR